MEVKELRDIIKEIHDSGDCGKELSEALEMANKICEQPSDLEIVQKALVTTNSTMQMKGHRWTIITGFGEISGESPESLLTWAKQTVGVE